MPNDDDFEADMVVNDRGFLSQLGGGIEAAGRGAGRVASAAGRTAFSMSKRGAKSVAEAIGRGTTSVVIYSAKPITVPVGAVVSAVSEGYSSAIDAVAQRNVEHERRANERFQARNAGMIHALSQPMPGGLMGNVELRNMIGAHAEANPTAMSAEEAVQMATIGEHLCKALADGREIGPDGLAVTVSGGPDGPDQTLLVPPGNFAARAVSWHLMACAAQSDVQRRQQDPQSQRSDMTNSGTFIMKDPGGRIYNFLNANPMVMGRMSTHYEERLDHNNKLGSKTIQRGCDDYQNKLPGGGGALLFDKMRNGELFVKFEHAGTPSITAREGHEGRLHTANRAVLALDRWRQHTLSFLDSRGAHGPDPHKIVRQEHLHKGEMKQPIYDPYVAVLRSAQQTGLITKKEGKEMIAMAKTHGLPAVQAGLSGIDARRLASPEPDSPACQAVAYGSNVLRGNIEARVLSMGSDNNALGIERRGGEVHISPDPNRYVGARQGQAIVQAASFTMGHNDMMTTAQANETHMLTAKPGHVLGKDGQTVAFAKYHFDNLDRQIQGARGRIAALQQDRQTLQNSSATIRSNAPPGTDPPGHMRSLIARNDAKIEILDAKMLVQQENLARLNHFKTNGMVNANPLVREDVIESERQIGLLTRSAASYATDNLLQLNTHAEERLGMDMDGIPISVSVQAAGVGVTSDHEGRSCFLAVDYRDANIQRGLADLEAADYITGQIDRHTGNIFVDPSSGKVTGIDNDLAFPEVPRNELTGNASKAIVSLPQFMHEETAQKILATSPQELSATLRSVQRPPGVEALSEEAIAGAVDRLQELQAAIRNPGEHGMTIVRQFDDHTYNECVARQVQSFDSDPLNVEAGITFGAPDAGHAGYGSAPRTSYLGAIIIERELNQLGQANEPDAFGTRTAESVPPLGVDPDVAEFKRTTDQLKAGYLVNPGRLPEGSPERRQLEQLHQQMQPMQDRLEDLNARIERLRHPSRLDQMRAVIKGGVPAEIASLREKQATVLKQLRPLEKQLDQVLDRAVQPQRDALRATMEDKAELGVQHELQAREARAIGGQAAGEAAQVARERAQRRAEHRALLEARHLDPEQPAPRQNQRVQRHDRIGDVGNLKEAGGQNQQEANPRGPRIKG